MSAILPPAPGAPPAGPHLSFLGAPWPLSGVVYGALLNHLPQLAALDRVAQAAPYKGLPQAPVLQVKPRNTLVASGAVVQLPDAGSQVEVGASLAIVMGQQATAVAPEQALSHVAGYTIASDLRLLDPSQPSGSPAHYRPGVRLRARDGFCPLGPAITPAQAVAAPDALAVDVWLDGALAQRTDTAERLRGVARLVSDVSAFMTLYPGDVVMLGPSAGAPLARAGQRVEIRIQGLGVLVHTVAHEAGGA